MPKICEKCKHWVADQCISVFNFPDDITKRALDTSCEYFEAKADNCCGDCRHFCGVDEDMGGEYGMCWFSAESKKIYSGDEACPRFVSSITTYGDIVRRMDNSKLSQLFGDGCPPNMRRQCPGNADSEKCRMCWFRWLNKPVDGKDMISYG